MSDITLANMPEGWRPDRLERLVQLARDAGPVRVAVVCPVDGSGLNGALESQRWGPLEPVLIGP